MSDSVSLTGQRGAGVYGRVPDPPAHRCGKCANPHTGGREDCPNNRRASRGMSSTSDCPARFCDRVDHAECWRRYEEQEQQFKYRRVGGFLISKRRK